MKHETLPSASMAKAFGDATFSWAYDLLDVAFLTWDEATGLCHFDRRWAALLGEELLGEAHSEKTPLKGHPPELKNKHWGMLSWLNCIHPHDRPLVDAAFHDFLEQKADSLEFDCRLKVKDGSWRHFQTKGKRNPEQPSILLLASCDRSILYQALAQSKYNSLHDPLTGLGNRTWISQKLEKRLRPSSSSGFSIIKLGIDGFKTINDSFGRSFGDILLKAVAARLLKKAGTQDLVSRVGGDEFIIVIDKARSKEELQKITDEIAGDMAIPFNLRGYPIVSSVSQGVVIHAESYREVDSLLYDANIALIHAKRNEGKKQKFFERSLRHGSLRRLILETDLRRDIDRGALELAYQPVMNVSTQELVGFEALCRWVHDDHGHICPSEFIPLAEDSGLIYPLGRFVLKDACKTAALWSKKWGQKDLWVAVNVSGHQLAQANFFQDVKEALEETGLAPHQLHLEMTESVLMENAEASRLRLEQLKALKVNISIDDFGTGYSSLSYLRRFPLHTLKIDRSFLLDSQQDKWVIVKTMISLANALHLDIIVEGVEEPSQLDYLKQFQDLLIQGFLISRPIPSSKLEAFFKTLGKPPVLAP